MTKGGNFTREISKEFSLYLTNMKTEDGVWNTEGSGSRATSRQKAKTKTRPDMFGDLTYTIPECKFWFDIFSIECKTGYAKKTKSKIKKTTTITHWSLMDLIDSLQKNPQFHEFWEQCLNDAVESKREPMLIFRRNRRTPCIAMHEDIFIGFSYKYGEFNFNYIVVQFKFTPWPIVVLNLQQFFDWTTDPPMNPKWLKTMVGRIIMRRKIYEA
jgi:hypothetical protein